MSSQRIQHLREEFEYTQDFVAEYLENIFSCNFGKNSYKF